MMQCAGLTLPDPSLFSPRMPILRRCDAFVANFTGIDFRALHCTCFVCALIETRRYQVSTNRFEALTTCASTETFPGTRLSSHSAVPP
ncbi:hypothetical protein EVAR_240_1 [Eumeta japonica]|uniref:Uncharacterized protein n=1 Tax=Eumeta variegata TaxID=151549 RepID=A0A4C1SBI5_EUMVA|nr:hypothetical protein EVAR_240_1 [Eumeta japonica]